MPHPTWPETALFLILLAASLFLFWRRIGPVVRTIRASKPDPGWRWGSFGERAANFAWEVLAQGKVIRERPLPGFAHALVFWGFLAFALVTADHFTAGIGIDLTSPDGAFGRLYFWLAGAFAVGVSFGITGLAIRRYAVRPKWLQPISASPAR